MLGIHIKVTGIHIRNTSVNSEQQHHLQLTQPLALKTANALYLIQL
jgi:hypothetical protein